MSSLGTSGTLMGVGLALKERLPGVKIVSAHPVRGHYIQGLKNLEEAIVPAIYDEAKIDRHIMIETEDAFDLARRLALEEGIFAGMSSGAALWAVARIWPRLRVLVPHRVLVSCARPGTSQRRWFRTCGRGTGLLTGWSRATRASSAGDARGRRRAGGAARPIVGDAGTS